MGRQSLRIIIPALGVVSGLALPCAAAAAPGAPIPPGPGTTLVIPASNHVAPGDEAVRAHTNLALLFRAQAVHGETTPLPGYYETPASLACLYGVTAFVSGCNPQTLTAVAAGGSKAIAIVDAYDYPTAANDLGVFSAEFGLPPVTGSNFKVVYAAGKKPVRDPSGGWEVEQALDIEMAHALAPNAMVFLVQAASNANADLLTAVDVAAKLVAAAGGGEVSASWGSAESSGEEDTETDFSEAGVVFFAAAGDEPGTIWPAVLSNVVSAGGTTVNRDGDGNYLNQSTWSSTGGGPSQFVPRPAYQNRIQKIVGAMRGTPDIALVANPYSGVWVYDSTAYEGSVPDWLAVGGTSVAAPASAALVNNAAHFFASSPLELAQVYAARNKSNAFTDIVSGTCRNGTDKAAKGWDYCSGVGTPLGTANK